MVGDFRLSVTQRDEIARDAIKLGLDLGSFSKWQEVKTRGGFLLSRIEHPPTGAHLTVHYHATYGSGYYLEFWPKTFKVDHTFTDWSLLRRAIGLWLKAVKEETEAADLWGLAQQERAWLTAPAPSTNTAFTPNEREVITKHLETLELYAFRNFQLTEAHQAHVREQLRYLTEATERLGRADWRGVAGHAILNIVITLGLNPVQARQFFDQAVQLLGPLVSEAARLISQ